MMYEELVKRLKSSARWYEYGMPIVPSVCLEAANSIEELDMELLNAKEFSDYADAIKEMKPKWIPVTENLPAAGQKAICFGKNGCMIGTYGEFGWMFPCYFGNVTHWMNLPEPQKEETC